MRRSTVLSLLPLQLVFPDESLTWTGTRLLAGDWGSRAASLTIIAEGLSPMS